MKASFFDHNLTYSQFIQLDTKKCKACWKCISCCTNNVIRKVDLPWHKHALIAQGDACTGCFKCIDVCEFGAYTFVDQNKKKIEKKMVKAVNWFIANNLLLISGLVTVISGMVLQIGFHMGGPEVHKSAHSQSAKYEQVRELDTDKLIWGFNYFNWSSLHKYFIVFFSLIMIYHFYAHWKWYKTIISKKLIGRNFQVISLSVIFVLVAVTGIVPWFIDLSGGNSMLRMLFIEIHDKLTLLLIIYMVLHIIKRIKWFSVTYEKIKSS
jgi:ferredoxin